MRSVVNMNNFIYKILCKIIKFLATLVAKFGGYKCAYIIYTDDENWYP